MGGTARSGYQIGVIGAGIIGMSSAYRLQTELSNVTVTVVSEDFTPNLTSDGVSGFWKPYDDFGTEPSKVSEWSDATFAYLKQLALSCEALQAGVMNLTAFELEGLPIKEVPTHLKTVEHFKRLTVEEAKAKNPTSVDGYRYTTFTCEPKIYLPWITKRFIRAGGAVRRERVTDLSKFCEKFDLVINCTGLQAAQLVPDSTMVPVRGQLVKIKGVNLLHATVSVTQSGVETYIFPGRDAVAVGGSFDVGEFNTDINMQLKERLLKESCRLEPSLKNGTVEMDWCGLRPSRTGGVRLEVDTGYHPTTKVIHNYGHGGIGVTLHWGCAGEVVSKASECLSLQVKLKSKL